MCNVSLEMISQPGFYYPLRFQPMYIKDYNKKTSF